MSFCGCCYLATLKYLSKVDKISVLLCLDISVLQLCVISKLETTPLRSSANATCLDTNFYVFPFDKFLNDANSGVIPKA